MKEILTVSQINNTKLLKSEPAPTSCIRLIFFSTPSVPCSTSIFSPIPCA